jgi:arginase
MRRLTVSRVAGVSVLVSGPLAGHCAPDLVDLVLGFPGYPVVMPGGIRLISWPFHNGLRGVGIGAGATRLAHDERLLAALGAASWPVSDDEVEPVDESEAEIARVMELVRRLAGRVRVAVEERAFPLVLAGNCNSCLGTVAGIGAEDLGVVWFDAHADFDDPEENTSGFFDVMGLAMLTGRGWRALRGTIPGHRPIPESDVILAGVRDLDPYQRRRLDASEVLTVLGSIEPAPFAQALSALSSRVSRIYLHVDLDSLDSSEARANEYAASGGPSLERLAQCVRLSCERFTVAGAAITAYDPSLDSEDRTLMAARRIAKEIAVGVRR